MGNLEGSVSRIPEAVPVKKKKISKVLIEKFMFHLNFSILLLLHAQNVPKPVSIFTMCVDQ